MTRFMHQQGSAIFSQAMPAAEIISSMRSIEVPMEVRGCYFSDGVISQKLINLLSVRGIPIVEGDTNLFAGTFFRVNNCLHFLLINGHWLLANYICASFQAL